MFYRITNDVQTSTAAVVEKLELMWVCGWRVDLFLFS
jgi:hypothetical protein